MKFNLSTREITLIGMCAALMAIFSQLSLPLPFTTVPVTLQIFAVVIISVIAGAQIGTLSLIIFELLGAIGLPVFANLKGGFGIIVGPTGGYLIGYIIMAFLIGYAAYKENKILLFIASYFGVSIDFFIGALQLKMVTGMNIQASLAAGVYPFIIKDFIATAVAIIIGFKVKKSVQNIVKKNVIA